MHSTIPVVDPTCVDQNDCCKNQLCFIDDLLVTGYCHQYSAAMAFDVIHLCYLFHYHSTEFPKWLNCCSSSSLLLQYKSCIRIRSILSLKCFSSRKLPVPAHLQSLTFRRNKLECIYAVINSSAITHLNNFLFSKYEPLKYESSIIISYCAKGSSTNILKLINIGAIYKILSYLELDCDASDACNNCDKYYLCVVKLISSICSKNSNKIIFYLLKNDVLNKLYALKKKINDLNVDLCAEIDSTMCCLIKAIPVSSRENINKLINFKLYKLLVSIINDCGSSMLLKSRIINCISSTAYYGNRLQIKHLVIVKTIPAICKHLNAIKSLKNGNVLPTLKCMKNILEGNRYHYADYVEMHGGLDILEDLYLHNRCKSMIQRMFVSYFGFDEFDTKTLIENY